VFNSISLFASNFDVSSIHAAAGDIAQVVVKYITPTLLILAIYTRILQDSLDTFSTTGSGVWARAVRDFILWGMVLASYFAIGSLIIKFANDIYRWADTVGGLKLITGDMSAAAKFIDEKMKSESTSSSLIRGFVTGGGTLTFITGLFYYLSLLIASFLIVALKIAHALVFGLAFIWGLIAIPVSVSKGIKLLRGWALILGFALVWPLIQALLLAIIRPSIIKALNAIMTQDTNAGVDMLSSDLLMTVLNLIFAATVVAAPYVASALVSNSPAAAAMVTPFVAAAMTGVSGVVGGAKMAGARLAGRGGGQGGAAVARKAAGSFGMGGGSSGGDTSKIDRGPSGAAPAAVMPPSPGASTDSAPKQKQQRRSVLINNLRKNK
jgi:hypothetical protein